MIPCTFDSLGQDLTHCLLQLSLMQKSLPYVFFAFCFAEKKNTELKPNQNKISQQKTPKNPKNPTKQEIIYC